MDKKQILKKIILEFNPEEIDLIERDYQTPLKTKNIISIIGPRRSGKTYFMYQLIKKLISQGADKRKIVFINFEDERLLPFFSSDFELIEEALYELYPDIKPPFWFFLDEVQNVENWEKFVRRLHEKNNYVFISGSSSKLLSYELATSLRGRTLSFFIYPFSFYEFLKWKRINLEKDFHLKKQRFIIKKNYEEYFSYGGLPQVFDLTNDLKIKYLQEYINLVIYKDIVDRYKIKNSFLIKELIRVLINETSNLFSVTNYYKILKNKGLNISKDTLFRYLYYFEDNNLIFLVPIYSLSKKTQLVNQRKVFIIDQGLYKALNFNQERGKILETMVFLFFKRQNKEIFYYREKYDIDLVIKNNKEILPVQVSCSLKDYKTWQRELQSLEKFMEKFKIKKGLIVTEDEWGKIEKKGKVFEIISYLGLK